MAGEMPRNLDADAVIGKYKVLLAEANNKTVLLEVAYDQLAKGYQELQSENSELKKAAEQQSRQELRGQTEVPDQVDNSQIKEKARK